MKKLIFIILTLCLIGIACEEKNSTDVYPKDIPFTEYSLEGTSCQWKYHSGAKQVIIINSNEELENYITCSDSGYPEIDFSKNTLLLASGGSGDIRQLDAVFFQNLKNGYTLKIIIHLGITHVVLPWDVKILVPKISDKAIVTLEKQETYN